MDAGFDIMKPINENYDSFLDILLKNIVNENRIRCTMSYLKKEISAEQRNKMIDSIEMNYKVAIADKKKVVKIFG